MTLEPGSAALLPSPVPNPLPFLDGPPTRIAFVAAPTILATEIRERLVGQYGEAEFTEAQVIVALGGDGFLLETLHRLLDVESPTPYTA